MELLVERAPNAVSKEEIQTSLWPETFVSEANLTTLVSDIRTAIGDSAHRPRYVRTVHRFGYAFSGGVTDLSSERLPSEGATLYRVVHGNRKFTLMAGENILGRHPDAGVQIDQTAVSRSHARISIQGSTAVLEDLKSRNGTFLRGRRIDSPAELQDGDVIGLGPVSLTFRVFSSPDSTEAVAVDNAERPPPGRDLTPSGVGTKISPKHST